MSEMPPDNDPESWLDAHGDAMFRYAAMRVRDNAVAEDLVQEAFVSALKSIGAFRGQSSTRTWLISILRHKILDHLRSQQRAPQATSVNLDKSAPPRNERLQRWSSDPAKVFEQKEFWEVFQKCTGKLPDSLADAYYLREIAGLSTNEICLEMDISANSLAIRIHRARVELRKCLDQNWFHPSGEREK